MSDSNLKIVVLGSAGVGKSCVIIRYLQNTFSETYDPTISNTYTKDVTSNGRTFHLEILDTAGMEDSNTLRETYVKGRDCYIFMYGVEDRTTFDEINNIYQDTLRISKSNSISAIIIANKCDLDQESREVSFEEGKQLADSLNASFLETSAKTGLRINEAFQIAIDKAAEKHPETNSNQKKKGLCLLI